MRNNSIRDLNSILIYKNATDVYSFKQSIHVMCIEVACDEGTRRTNEIENYCQDTIIILPLLGDIDSW